MKNNKLNITIILGMIFFCFNIYANNDAILVKKVNIDAKKAITLAQKRENGFISKLEFEKNKNNYVWEVEIVNKQNQVYDIEIDAISGKILKHKLDKQDKKDTD